jgi:multifunctional 2-oxoglutarate metabolism enzyme
VLASSDFDQFGPNAGLIEDLYHTWLETPGAVPDEWRRWFASSAIDADDHGWEPSTNGAGVAVDVAAGEPTVPGATGGTGTGTGTRDTTGTTGPAGTTATGVIEVTSRPATPGATVFEGDTTVTLRGASARIAENMSASLTVPTATSVRDVPAKLLEVNRTILNNHLNRHRQGKVSFTHVIAFAVVRALRDVPAMNAGFAHVDGQPTHVRHAHVNLGLAVDLEKADGSHNLVVPNIKRADTMDFQEFRLAYEDCIRKARSGKLGADDLAGTTVTVTNPGTVGTVHSVPRLMPGQGCIVGVGAIDVPAAFAGADPATLARMGVGKTITLTSTYDHRIIQGAESGEFLGRVHRLLVGDDDFYDEVFASAHVPYEPARWTNDINPQDETRGALEKQARVFQLINMYRVRAHLMADLDPLGMRQPKTHHELDLAFWGLSIWDLDREFLTGGLASRPRMALRDILGVLRDAYARTIGVEYMHIQEVDQKGWIQDHVEGVANPVTHDDRVRILDHLRAAELFERFLGTKYLGHKRFGIEGGESLIPMLVGLLDAAADDGCTDVVMGMAHRGRLNVLANVIGKSYGQMFREFEGELDPTTTQGSGDVKYHLGATGKHTSPAGRTIDLRLSANPSHLEAVDPVVQGMARAMADKLGPDGARKVVPVVLHGDAAFAGQGVVAETFNLSALPGYGVGGTIHVVINNQVGFTTSPDQARSTVYPTDVAKMVQAPIFHVNGDDPEACLRVARLAFTYRQVFGKDVVIDMWCYRRHGHNETDEPSYTQPRMYAQIDKHPSVRELYLAKLVDRGDATEEQAAAARQEFEARLQAVFEEAHLTEPPVPERLPLSADMREAASTAVPHAHLARVVDALVSVPEGFTVHPKLARQITARRELFEQGLVDWALAEHLAIGSLLLEGHPVRLAGQDSQRGTFSHRHAVLVDNVTEAEHTSLAHLEPVAALSGSSNDAGGSDHGRRTVGRFEVWDSLLSEFAGLGFEYGYSVIGDTGLVCWEAQFGDFVNGAQVIIDQFLAAAESKWAQLSSLVMLLPHGYEGQGPEHSSARIERFLTLCAEDNMRVCYPTTGAQYFHLLRRQVHSSARRPLVVFTPKKYLRMPATRSNLDELTGGHFREVLGDATAERDAAAVTRILVASGKIAHELIERRDHLGAPVAVVRLEQYYPFRDDRLLKMLERFPNARQVTWVQEEPENMGGWSWIDRRLFMLVQGRWILDVVARPESGSPATGSAAVHDREHELLLQRSFAGLG